MDCIYIALFWTLKVLYNSTIHSLSHFHTLYLKIVVFIQFFRKSTMIYVMIFATGGTIHMVCRNKDKAEEARADIVKETGNKEVYVHILDLSETKKVWEFAEGFKRKYKSLNVLINNAGAIMSQRDLNAEGLEKSFATNVLGVYILTKSLIPLLEKSVDPRVITVSSGGMLVQKLRTGNLQSERGRYDGTMVYAQHKRQQVVMTEQLAKTHTNIHFSVMHPGWVDTPAVANAMPDFHQSMKDSLRTPEQGADTVVWLSVSEAAVKNPSGRFYQVCSSLNNKMLWSTISKAEERSNKTRTIGRPVSVITRISLRTLTNAVSVLCNGLKAD
uniref:Dehydrogenase/reductase 12-like a n=1 Tax=Haplochromis burtoni TaxID=8153 RepID=A0A3Q2X6B9_HAPBU